MLKHVQISPLRNRSDSVSLRSSTSCATSICGSPEPTHPVRSTPSRASSYSSLSEQLPQTTIKVFTNCLKIDIEYKTLGIQWDTTSKEVITQLLRRLKMRHRDPRLFYLSMEVSVRSAGVKTILVLDEDTRPAILQACHPKGESRFCLQLKPGGLIRIHTSALQPSSQYKSLVISEETTSDELLQLLLSCYNCPEPVEQYSIYEVCPGQEYQRKLHPDDIPLRAQAERMKRGETCHFLVRRNPSYALHRRRQLLSALNSVYDNAASQKNNNSSTTNNNNNNNSNDNTDVASVTAEGTATDLDDDTSLLNMSIESISEELQSLLTNSDEDDVVSVVTASSSSSSSSSSASSNSSTTVSRSYPTPTTTFLRRQHSLHAGKECVIYNNNNTNNNNSNSNNNKLKNSTIDNNRKSSVISYNPVYNIREIRSVSKHCFSPLGSDKKLLDMELNGRFELQPVINKLPTQNNRLRPQSLCLNRTTGRMNMNLQGYTKNIHNNSNNNNNNKHNISNSLKSNTAIIDSTSTQLLMDNQCKSSIPISNNINNNNNNSNNNINHTNSKQITFEAVNNNPAKGLGHFVYL